MRVLALRRWLSEDPGQSRGHQSTRRCRAAHGLGLQTNSTGAFGWWGAGKCLKGLVDLEGFEPSTSSMPWKRAPNCATGPRVSFNIARAGTSDGAASQHEARNAGCSAPAGCTCRGRQLSLATRCLRRALAALHTNSDNPGCSALRFMSSLPRILTAHQASATHVAPRRQAAHAEASSFPSQHAACARRLVRAGDKPCGAALSPTCTPSIGNARCSAPAGGKCRFGRPALQRAPPAHARSVSR